MYQRDISHLPTKISRDHFIDLIFDIGTRYSHGYDSIVASVQLGDYFVNYKGTRKPFYNNDTSSSNELSEQIYSTELAHVVTVIIAKFNEDYGYNKTKLAVSDTNNKYVIKLEWEISMILNFHVRVNNFITVISKLICSNYSHNPLYTFKFGSIFYDISRDICNNQDLLSKNPYLIVAALLLLHKHGKLRSIKIHKQRIFSETICLISDEFELDIPILLNEINMINK